MLGSVQLSTLNTSLGPGLSFSRIPGALTLSGCPTPVVKVSSEVNPTDGFDGFDGVEGVDGFDGFDGVEGVDGVDGEGTDGVEGVDGVDGEGTDGDETLTTI